MTISALRHFHRLKAKGQYFNDVALCLEQGERMAMYLDNFWASNSHLNFLTKILQVFFLILMAQLIQCLWCLSLTIKKQVSIREHCSMTWKKVNNNMGSSEFLNLRVMQLGYNLQIKVVNMKPLVSTFNYFSCGLEYILEIFVNCRILHLDVSLTW